MKMGDGAVLCCDNDPERGWEEGVQGALWVRWGGVAGKRESRVLCGQMGRRSSRHTFPVTGLDGRRSWRIQDIVGLMFVSVHRGRVFILPKRGETFLLRLNTCSVTQSCLTLCGPMGCSMPGSSVHGISQARILEWAAMPSR